MKVYKSNYKVTLKDVGQVVKAYNGKLWVPLTLIEHMVGHFIGEFLVTKRLGSVIHRIKKKKKKSKQK
jgi:ribosomal protein S19